MGKKNTQEALADETDKLLRETVDQGVDCVIGGFPCQDISSANNNPAGLAGKRSGLFWEMVEAVRVVRPKYWLMENVAALLDRGMAEVLSAVAASGYNAEWDCISASAAGAPHHRGRIYILANNFSDRIQRRLPRKIQRQREFNKYEGIRSIEDFEKRSDSFAPFFCRRDDGTAKRLDAFKRLHAIGNGNPPCIIREIAKSISLADREEEAD